MEQYRREPIARCRLPLLSLGGILLFVLGGLSSDMPAGGTESPETDPPETPAWARENLPSWVAPFVGKQGLPDPWPQKKGPLGSATSGIDRWQANHFIVYRPETAAYLYQQYTPTKVAYRRGSLPAYEKVVEKYARGDATDRQKAMALLKSLADVCRHPTIPPLGPRVRADRGLLDEDLLKSGGGFCNEQARVFVRLCQVAGIPARMVFLFYADNRTGHVVAEFFADGRWSMADTSWLCVFPAEDGHLLSAAEIHADEAGRQRAIAAYRARWREMLAMSDEYLGGPGARTTLEKKLAAPDVPGCFGVLNYPLP